MGIPSLETAKRFSLACPNAKGKFKFHSLEIVEALNRKCGTQRVILSAGDLLCGIFCFLSCTFADGVADFAPPTIPLRLQMNFYHS
jgi:hypothetical protein